MKLVKNLKNKVKEYDKKENWSQEKVHRTQLQVVDSCSSDAY